MATRSESKMETLFELIQKQMEQKEKELELQREEMRQVREEMLLRQEEAQKREEEAQKRQLEAEERHKEQINVLVEKLGEARTAMSTQPLSMTPNFSLFDAAVEL